MAFNIGDFSKKFTGYTRSAHFEASITLPAWAQAKGYQDSDFLKLRCHAVNLPGTDMELFSARTKGSGASEFFPIGVNFSPVNMVFFNDENSKILKLFREWSANIVDIGQTTSDESFRINYRSDYLSTIIIDQFDGVGNISARYNIKEAFPASISSVNLNWAATDQITELPVTFVYKSFSISDS